MAGGAPGAGGTSRLAGVRLPTAWHSFEEVPRGAYLSGAGGRLQRFEIMVEMTEVRRSASGSPGTPRAASMRAGMYQPMDLSWAARLGCSHCPCKHRPMHQEVQETFLAGKLLTNGVWCGVCRARRAAGTAWR